MKLAQIRIRNFRCYRDEFALSFDALTCIIAKNDAGKSTVLEALDAFFNLEKLDSEDRSIGVANATPIEMTCIFRDLQTSLVVDSDATISPQNEYLLNADGYLEITKRFSGASPKCEEVLVKAMHPSADRFNDLFSLSIAQLRRRAQDLGIGLEGVNQTVKSALRHAIWNSVPRDALRLTEVQLEVKASIWKPLQNALPLYQLFRADRPSSDQDAEAQDPLKYAIREALASQQAQLETIGNQVKQQVESVTRATIEKIREMDPALAGELNPVFSSLNWSKVFSVSLTAEDQVPLNKRGSGVRRLFLINFFRAKAEQLAGERGAPDVILAIEEPETSQHPNNQLLLLEALLELSQSPSTQVILTTHNPLLARKINQDQIRFIEVGNDRVRSLAPNDEAASIRLRDTLGILPNHNVRVFVGVEGPNDIEFLSRVSALLSVGEVDIPDLRRAEQAGTLVYIPMGGSTLELWTNRLQGLEIPEVHIMDRDNPPPGLPKYHASAARVNARGPAAIAFTTSCREMENLLHREAIFEEFGQAPALIQPFDDVPALVAELVHAASGSPNPWASLDEDKRNKKISNAKRRLNRGAADRMTPERLHASDQAGEVRTWLRRIGQIIL
ncbi:MAG: putative ATP-dependent endonuclease of the OLD family [Azoarcus sp.]|nr:putative ATP-dependent endonuclease of the OLD family [Azoarcus sp.]